MTAFRDSYQVIQSYEKFKELIDKRGLVLLLEREPSYCQRFRTCETLRLKLSQTVKECNPLLSGKFNRFVDLLESLYEVGYYWKRLTETARLLEVNAPKTPINQIDEASWFIYNLDFYWHAAYGLEDRIIRFLKIFKRLYKSQDTEEAKLLKTYIGTFNTLKTKGTKLVRDPLSHFRSQGIQGWRNVHQWETALLRNYNADFVEGYDRGYLEYKDFYLDNIRTWIPQYSETLSVMFESLSTFSLERLEL